MKEHLYSVIVAATSAPVIWGSMGSDGALPRVSVFQVSAVRMTHGQGKGLIQGRVQIDVYGRSPESVAGLGRTIREALEGYSGGPIEGLFLDSIRDGSADDVTILDRESMTFAITYRE